MSQPGIARVTKRGGIYHRSYSTLVQRTHGFYSTLSNGVGPEVGESHLETPLLVCNKAGPRNWEICHSTINKYLMNIMIKKMI